MKPFVRCFLTGLAVFSLAGFAQEPEESPSLQKAELAGTNAPVREIEPGILALGDVRVNRAQKSLSFPAVVNLHESLAEYLVVTTRGKIHESILRTEAQPYQIHLGMLLLGAKGAQGQEFPQREDDPLPGDPFVIEVEWESDGTTSKVRGETLARRRLSRQAMGPTSWIYNGSLIFQGDFLAQQEGSIVALYTDPVALANYPGPDRDNDENWEPNPSALPELESLVRVIFRLPEKASDGSDSSGASPNSEE